MEIILDVIRGQITFICGIIVLANWYYRHRKHFIFLFAGLYLTGMGIVWLVRL